MLHSESLHSTPAGRNRSVIRARRHRLARAFSLIEVLFAVFILALGLLGLGAMIPAVIREQRQSADATMGVIVANSAKAYLLNRPDLNRFNDQKTAVGWNVLHSRSSWSPDFSWEPRPAGYKSEQTGADAADEPKVYFNVSTGRLRIQQENNATGTPCFIRVQDRLWPDAAMEGIQPQFVWDVVPRRVPVEAGRPRQVQLAVFVRRIDPNIRVPVGATLYKVLTQQVPQAQWRVPVGVQANIPVIQRRPTLDGTGQYARPFKVSVTYNPQYPSRIQLHAGEQGIPLTWDLFSRPGQKIVDNLGNVYTVVAEDPAQPFTVRVEPPVDGWIEATVDDPGLPPPPEATAAEVADFRRKCRTLRQVLLTSQVPAAVSVFSVSIENPSESPTGSGVGSVSP